MRRRALARSTIGGLLFGTLGRLPKVGDHVPLGGAVFEILDMDGRRVGKVRVAAAGGAGRGASGGRGGGIA